jgi:hypothetical protein
VKARWHVNMQEWFDGLRTHCVKIEAGKHFRNGKIEVRHCIWKESYARLVRNAHRVVVFRQKACCAYYQFGVD